MSGTDVAASVSFCGAHVSSAAYDFSTFRGSTREYLKLLGVFVADVLAAVERRLRENIELTVLRQI